MANIYLNNDLFYIWNNKKNLIIFWQYNDLLQTWIFYKRSNCYKDKILFQIYKGVFNWIQLTIANTDGCNKKDSNI